MPSSRVLSKLALLGGAAFAVLLLVGVPGLGQTAIAPEGELDDAECYGHHRTEGFRSMDLFPEVVSQIPRDQQIQLNLTIRNPWLHELRDVFGYLNISGAPGLSFPGERDPTPIAEAGSLAPSTVPGEYTPTSHVVLVEANATEIVLSLRGNPSDVSSPSPLPVPVNPDNDFDLKITSPGGNIVLVGPDPYTGDSNADFASPATVAEDLRVDQQSITLGGLGEWIVEVAYRGAGNAGEYTLDGAVYYNLSKSPEIIVPGPKVLLAGEQHTFTFTVNARDAVDLQAIRYGGIVVAYHEHTDRNIGDVGNYNKWNTFTSTFGDSLVVGTADIAITQIDTLSPVFRRWGQVLGFAASVLIIPSLVFGGTFGRGSVLAVNKLMGSPRRRVLFHNSMSFWLLGLSVLHLFLFLWESFWNWSHGLVWGGLALAAMIGLGVTGATQRRFVAQWGFNRWRFVHFAMGILVAVFVLAHMVADGSHLAIVRDLFGP